ncbi:predicted protein [Sclerotinia sclerotiorum 1980 UF-70]|uniref:Uncharacterized protein n=1 Tax=Sclerotinia sclerotiorum (strain ATCC 18683 / 1980 / Ss-1) TaxID=665079 RepID=A7EUD6_SCLS1|nr:predicted protein [Sclerotinia sclerotiorum 1980 UF-70]EDN93078.1 predicted protein [Sclerotinia sclerotiorum 1980 UF-70]
MTKNIKKNERKPSKYLVHWLDLSMSEKKSQHVLYFEGQRARSENVDVGRYTQ